MTKLGIAPAGIQKQLAQQYGVDCLDGLYNRVVSLFPRPADKRQYNSFPVPHKGADGRYRANLTLYAAGGKKQLSIAGNSLADYEIKVFRKLAMVYLQNRSCKAAYPEAHDKSVDSILRFRKTVKTKEAKQELDFLIKGCNLESKKGGENT